MKPALSEVVLAYYRQHMATNTMNRDIMATIVTAVIAEMTHTIRQDTTYDACNSIAELPLLSSFLLGVVCKRKLVEGLVSCNKQLYKV